jgi:hypothetical protein
MNAKTSSCEGVFAFMRVLGVICDIISDRKRTEKDDKESLKFDVHRNCVIRDGVFCRVRNNTGAETTAGAYDREQFFHFLHEPYTDGCEVTRA